MTDTDNLAEQIKAAIISSECGDNPVPIFVQERAERLTAAVLPIIRAQRAEALRDAWEEWASGLAIHLDGATPHAWGFHHPCDPPGVRWEPSEAERAFMGVADFLRDREANPNPYREQEN